MGMDSSHNRRHCERSEAIRGGVTSRLKCFSLRARDALDCFAARAMTERCCGFGPADV
jgi:hypothetical protein